MQEKLIEQWYEKRMASNLTPEQKREITRIKNLALKNGWTAYTYEVAVRNKLGLVKVPVLGD